MLHVGMICCAWWWLLLTTGLGQSLGGGALCDGQNLGGGGECSAGGGTEPRRQRASAFLLIGVMTAQDDGTPGGQRYSRRAEAIRRTWASTAGNGGEGHRSSTKVIFVVGESPGKTLDPSSRSHDQAQHGVYDAATSTLRVPVEERYGNLIDKLKYFIEFAHANWEFEYLMKADDDTFVSIPGIVKFLEAAPSTRLYAGHFYTGAPVRDPAHKNYVGLECYPLPCFPAYAWGGGYILSSDVSGHLAQNAEFIWAGVMPSTCRGNVEDVQMGLFMMGLGVRPWHTAQFSSVLQCTASAIVLFDLPASLQSHVGESARGATVNSTLCSQRLRQWNANALRNARIDSGVAINSGALASALALNCTGAIEGLERGIANAATSYDISVMQPNLDAVREYDGRGACAELREPIEAGMLEMLTSISTRSWELEEAWDMEIAFRQYLALEVAA